MKKGTSKLLMLVVLGVVVTSLIYAYKNRTVIEAKVRMWLSKLKGIIPFRKPTPIKDTAGAGSVGGAKPARA